MAFQGPVCITIVYMNNGQIWADAVAGKFEISPKVMDKSFDSTEILMQEYVHNNARPIVLSDTFLISIDVRKWCAYNPKNKVNLNISLPCV